MVDIRRYLENTVYRDLDVDRTLDYMRRRYLEPLRPYIDFRNATLADCGAGYGWLSFAYLRAGGRGAILVDQDCPRLEKAAGIAEALGCASQCEFRCQKMQDLDIGPVEIFATIETLEHVGQPNIRRCIERMASTTSKAVVLSTPNFCFPIIAHDTELPFAHWMPLWLRTWYAVASGHGDRERTNAFVSPLDLRPLWRRGFRPVSRYQTFTQYSDFLSFYPHYLPYGDSDEARYRARPKPGLAAYVRIAGALAGRAAFAISPNLTSLWVRNGAGDSSS